MARGRSGWVFGAVLGGALLAAAIRPAPAQIVVPTKDPAHPRIKYADSLLSLNDRCIVRQGRMNPLFKPVYINGRPVGFC